MNCKSIQDKLYDYLTNRLNNNASIAVAEHISSCPGCRNALDELKITLNIVDQALPPEPPADLNDRVMRSLQQQKALQNTQGPQTAKIIPFPKRERFDASQYFDDLPMVVNRGGVGASDREATTKAVNLYNQGTMSEDLDEKEKLFLQALQAGCTDKKVLAKICNNLADCYERLGRIDESIAAYKKAFELDPELYIALLSLGDIYKFKGTSQEALIYYEKALAVMEGLQQQGQIDSDEIVKTRGIISGLGSEND